MGLARLSRPALAAVVATGCLFGSVVIAHGASATPVEGTPLTFGANELGQLGDDSNIGVIRAAPGVVPGLTDVIDIAGGREHALALREDGTVWAWGSDNFGQQGNGPGIVTQFAPAPVTGLTDVVDVDDGHRHSIALKSDGTVWTWGFGSLGQLGVGYFPAQIHTPMQFGEIDDATEVTGGNEMTYVLRADGTVWCSGQNANGECGGTIGGKFDSPVAVPGIQDVVKIAAGRNNAIVIRADGTVWTWGDNEFGQLGDGTTDDSATPRQVEGLSDVVDVAGGAAFSMAVTADGSVYTWGEGDRGELGVGDTDGRPLPTLVPGISNAANAEAGRDHALVITDEGHLLAWGWNDWLQTGIDIAGDVLSPVEVPGLTNVIGAAGGQAYSVVLQKTAIDPGGPVLSDGFDNGLVGWNGGLAFAEDGAEAPLAGALPSLRATLTNSRLSAWRALPNSLADSCTSLDVRVASRSTAFGILRLRASDGSGLATVLVVGHRKFRVRDELNGHVFNTTQAIPVGEWHNVKLCSSNPAVGTDQLTLSYDGSVVGSWSGEPTGDVGQIQIGSTRKGTATFNLDNVLVDLP